MSHLNAHPQCIHYVDIASPEIFLDVDTPEEYQQMQKLWMKKTLDMKLRGTVLLSHPAHFKQTPEEIIL